VSDTGPMGLLFKVAMDTAFPVILLAIKLALFHIHLIALSSTLSIPSLKHRILIYNPGLAKYNAQH